VNFENLPLAGLGSVSDYDPPYDPGYAHLSMALRLSVFETSSELHAATTSAFEQVVPIQSDMVLFVKRQ